MAKSVGIDLGSFSTKILGLENAGKGYRITHFSDDPIPATVEDGSIAQHVAGRFKDHRLSRDSVVMGARRARLDHSRDIRAVQVGRHDPQDDQVRVGAVSLQLRHRRSDRRLRENPGARREFGRDRDRGHQGNPRREASLGRGGLRRPGHRRPWIYSLITTA